MGYPPVPSELFQAPAMLAPQRLVWVFMAASPLYQVFTGAVETIGGVLLMVRRTSLLGALIGTAAMLNVAVIDWSYDIFLDLRVTHLTAMGVVLIAGDRRRLASLLLDSRAVAVPASVPLFGRPRLNRVGWAIGTAFLVWTLGARF